MDLKHPCRRVMAATLLSVAVVAAVAAQDTRRKPPEETLLGTRPVEWKLTHWTNGSPVDLKDLKGKVVLVRWWTAPGCSYCRVTAPALNEFHDAYQAQGLEVLGVYHHKLSTPLDPAAAWRQAREFGFKFPVAIDPQWRTLKKWWLEKGDTGFTSVSFLLDRQGVIRHIHPGGQYLKGDPDYLQLKSRIQQLLAEPPGA